MRKFTLSILFFSIALSGFSTTWTVVNVGDSFSPSTLTIVEGDDVDFNLEFIHNSVEVSEATWNANGTTPLAGGWNLPLGGGNVPAGMLEVGTHYYVCQPHASSGMKGIIIVQASTSVDDNPNAPSFSFYPNPASGRIQVILGNTSVSKNTNIEIYNVQGHKVYSKSNVDSREAEEIEIELSAVPKGLYIIRMYDEEGIRSRRLILQ